MDQFECPKVIHLMVSFTFGVHCVVPFSLHAGKGKCSMWLVIKGKCIRISKISFMDSKWSILIAPG